MYKAGKYLPNDLMSDLICDNYPMLLVMSRFGIDLGFGENTIAQVCQNSNVDLDTFLAVVNVLTIGDKHSLKIDYSKISLLSLTQYLHNSHDYFLNYRLPDIRDRLIESIDKSDNAVSIVIINYYDEYVAEVNKHMMYEEETLFPYVKAITQGISTDGYSAAVYSEHHDNIETKLSELKNIIIKYYPAKTTNQLNNVLYNIFSCERDLASHGYIEDFLLVPAIKDFELNK